MENGRKVETRFGGSVGQSGTDETTNSEGTDIMTNNIETLYVAADAADRAARFASGDAAKVALRAAISVYHAASNVYRAEASAYSAAANKADAAALAASNDNDASAYRAAAHAYRAAAAAV